MSRFNTADSKTKRTVGILTAERPDALTHEGAPGFTHDARGELFLSAVSSFTSNSFYENETARSDRQRTLLSEVALKHPEWLLSFLRWLRHDAGIRTNALTLAADAVWLRLQAKVTEPEGINRKLISAVLARMDEPGEMLAYWTSTYGKAIPKPVKRGVADAVVDLLAEYSFLKYDSKNAAFRIGDVIELTHPCPSSLSQGALFEYAIGVRHGREDLDVSRLPKIKARNNLRALTPADIHQLAADGLLVEHLRLSGMTWEAVPSLVNGPWTRDLWQAVLPQLGVMAAIRNARNLDEAGITTKALAPLFAKLADPEQVRRFRVMPMRFYAAYKAVSNVRWHAPLEAALQHSLSNVPALGGNTLILVDRSGSMFGRVSDRSELTWADSAALFGSALALRAEKATLVEFGTSSNEITVPKGGSVLPLMSRFTSLGGTYTVTALERHLRPGHTRVVILTDEQNYGGYYHTPNTPGDVVPKNVPLHTFNLAGYRSAHTAGTANRYWYGGLTDASWPLLRWNEEASEGFWPWLPF